MSGGGSGGSTQTIQKADPWEGVQPYLRGLYQDAFNAPIPSYYPNSTVAPMNARMSSALDLGWNRGLAGSPVVAAAKAAATKTASGGYLGSDPANGYWRSLMTSDPATNPYLDKMVTAATRGVTSNYTNAVMPGIASMFSSGGRFGSNGLSAALANGARPMADAVSDAASRIYGGAYQSDMARRDAAASALDASYGRERGLQQGAIGLAPALAETDWNDLAKLLGIGQTQQDQSQREIDADVARWDFGQEARRKQLSWANSILQGGLNFGSTSTTGTQSASRNPFLGAAGGALTGSVIGPLLGATGPIGALAGLALGGLFG